MVAQAEKIEKALRNFFPLGTTQQFGQGWDHMPSLATDVFAFAAHLIEQGGIYHRVIIEKPGRRPSEQWANPRHLILTEGAIKDWCELGRSWGGWQVSGSTASRPTPEAIRAAYDRVSKDYWQPLIACGPEFTWTDFTPWGKYAFALLIIADEASRDLGYQLDDETLAHPIEKLMRDLWVYGDSTRVPIDSNFPPHQRATKKFTNFATVANAQFYRVMPKSRTPFVGNTMRTLSHNLALVPPIGRVDLNWHRELRAFKENREPLNLLLVPFPYSISARCFVPQKGHTRNDIQHDQWSCMFDVHQRWLTQNGERHDDATSNNDGSQSKIVEFIAALIDQSQREVPKLHGLLLPELALDWGTYHELVKRLTNDANESGISPKREALDFIICGSSTDWGDGTGNFVLVTTFSTNDDGKPIATTYSQPKHHRWRLIESQISGYGLSASLDPHVVWWEGIEIPRREVGLTVFRRGSIFAAMICEDLARSEPCHEPLKSVGPNLVFALLMDGPQLPHRWSARYATSLADDPGSSVLTLTSLGLIERMNSAGAYKECRNISLWKDDKGRTVEISCPRDAQAILLTLGGHEAREQTADGRLSTDATSWRYQGHQPVSLSDTDAKKYDWIVRGK